MYGWRTRAVVAAVVMIAYATTAQAGDVQLPLRKAGYWELKTAMDEGKGPREQALNICIGAEKEAETAKASQAEHQSSCSKYDVRRDGDRTIVESDCTYGGSPVSTRTEMSGDFQTAFAVNIESTTQRQTREGQTIPHKRTITQVGKYLGEACAAGLQPGEAMGPDGQKVVVQ